MYPLIYQNGNNDITSFSMFTKVIIDWNYIAKENEHDIILSAKKLQLSTVSKSLYGCTDTLLHPHCSKHSCENALLLYEKLESIKS